MKKIDLLLAATLAIFPLAAYGQAIPAAPAAPPVGAPDATPAPAPAAPTPPAQVAPSAVALGQLVIRDTFQENPSTENYPNVDLTLVKIGPVNATGAGWQLATGDDTYETFITTATASTGDVAAMKNSTAGFHNVAAGAVSLASNGAYVKPATMTISADLSFGGPATGGYDVLGFYSALSGKSTTAPLANFTGLQLQTDGSLQLVENGTPATTAAIAYTGKYDPTKPVTLTYTVDTAAGTISNVTLSGSTSTYTFTSKAFTNAATAFAGIGGQTGGESWSFFNNFQIASGNTLPAQDVTKAPAPAKTP